MKLKLSAERESQGAVHVIDWDTVSCLFMKEVESPAEETETAKLDRIWFETFIHPSAGEFCA